MSAEGETGHMGKLPRVAVSADCKRVVGGSEDAMVRLFNIVEDSSGRCESAVIEIVVTETPGRVGHSRSSGGGVKESRNRWESRLIGNQSHLVVSVAISTDGTTIFLTG